MEDISRSMRQNGFLRDLSDEHIHFVTSCARNVRFHAGDFVIREGADADTLFLVRSGRVALEIVVPGRAPTQVEMLREGDILGWSWMFAPYKWQLDARAVEPTLAFAFDAKCVRAKMEADHAFGYALSRPLLFHLHQRLERVRMQRLDLYGAGAKGIE